MAKGSAKERTLGGLHAKLADVFINVLEGYEKKLAAQDKLLDKSEQVAELETELLDAALLTFEPSPAMLSAVAKFLKDNDIGLDSEEIDKLSDTERRLKDKARKRPVNLSVVPLAADG